MATSFDVHDPGRGTTSGDVRSSVWKAAGHALLFVIGFLSVSQAVRAYDWRGLYADVTREKVDHLLESGEVYDTLFVGSSRMYAGVIPATFDEASEGLGLSTRSFNTAACAMGMHEANALLRDLCERLPVLPKRVVVELHWWDPLFRAENHRTTRAVGWHDLGETLSVLRSLALPVDAAGNVLRLAEKATLLRDHLKCWAGNQFRVGQGVRLVRELWSPKPDANGAYPEELERGYCELGKANRWGRRARRRFLSEEGRASFAESVVDAGDWDRSQKGLNLAAFERQADFLASRGIDLVYMVAPTIESTPGRGDLEVLRRRVPVLEYDNPREVPEYFEVENRFDTRHLNRQGGEDFSARLAADCARVWAESGQVGRD